MAIDRVAVKSAVLTSTSIDADLGSDAANNGTRPRSVQLPSTNAAAPPMHAYNSDSAIESDISRGARRAERRANRELVPAVRRAGNEQR